MAHFPGAAVHQDVNSVVTAGAADDAVRGAHVGGPEGSRMDGRDARDGGDR